MLILPNINLVRIIQPLMPQLLCPFCHSNPKQPLNLRCDHNPCYECSLKFAIKIQEDNMEESRHIQMKYEIKCPCCQIKTISYNLKNLIINFTQGKSEEENYYLSSQFLQKSNLSNLQKIKQFQDYNVEKKTFNLEKSVWDSNTHEENIFYEKNSKIKNSLGFKDFELECQQHKQKIKYFCFDCHKSVKTGQILQSKPLLCCYCLHLHEKNHNILTLSQSMDYICKFNNKSQQQIKGLKYSLKQFSEQLTIHKTQTIQYFTSFEKQIQENFHTILNLLNKKFSEIKNELKGIFSDTVKRYNSKVELLKTTKLQLEILEKDKLLQDERCNLKSYQDNIKFCSLLNQLNTEVSQTFQKPQFFSETIFEVTLQSIQKNLKIIKNEDSKRPISKNIKFSKKKGLQENNQCLRQWINEPVKIKNPEKENYKNSIGNKN